MYWQPHNSPQSVMELVVIDSSYLKFYSKGRERRRAIDVRCKRVEKLWALRENRKLSSICSPDEEKETREDAKRRQRRRAIDVRCKRVEKLWALRENRKLSSICSPDEEKETREAKRAASLHSADIARSRCEEAYQDVATYIKAQSEEIKTRTKIVFCNTSDGKCNHDVKLQDHQI